MRQVALIAVFCLMATSSWASDQIRPSNVCLTKLHSTFRLMELYVEADDVDTFLLDQLDITERLCRDTTDQAFSTCSRGLDDVASLARAQRGQESRDRAIQAQTDCDAYRNGLLLEG